MTEEDQSIEETHKLYRKVLRDVAGMNNVRLSAAAIPKLYTFPEVQRLLEEYKVPPKKRTRKLSRQEIDVVNTYIERKAVDQHRIAYYNKRYNYIAFLCGVSEKTRLMHEVQHMIDTKIYKIDSLLSEFRANAVSAGMRDYVSGMSEFFSGMRGFENFCNRAKESAGKRFILYDLLSYDAESDLGRILSYPFLCGVRPHRIRVIHHPTVRWTDASVNSIGAPYYSAGHWGLDRYPYRKTRKTVLALTLKIHQEYGKTPAAKIFLKRYCGIRHIRGPVWQFCQTGFPQETAELGDYECESLRRRAIECLEKLAKSN